MEVRELRIGNLVYFNGNHNEIGVVSEIIKKGVTKFTPYKIGINQRIDIYYEIDKLKPIPLTEEWLLKLGFRTEESSCFELDNIHINTKRELMWIFTKCKNNIEIEIPEFIHQLQNLYFALTNEELTLKS